MNKKSEITAKEIIKQIALNQNEKFVFDENNKKIYHDLLYYFTGNVGDLDLKKGIYLYGSFGLGKTTAFLIMREFVNMIKPFNQNSFMITSVEGIMEHYKAERNLIHFGKNIIDGRDKTKHLLINEFGKDAKETYFGTSFNEIINSLIMTRYEVFQEHNKVTHITSNYAPNQLKVDNAVNDRLHEMFNFVKIGGVSRRK